LRNKKWILSNFPLFIPKGDFGELGETKGISTFLIMLAITRFTLSSRLTYTPIIRSKNQQIVEMKIIKES
jgi:hypothetical protein